MPATKTIGEVWRERQGSKRANLLNGSQKSQLRTGRMVECILPLCQQLETICPCSTNSFDSEKLRHTHHTPIITVGGRRN